MKGPGGCLLMVFSRFHTMLIDTARYRTIRRRDRTICERIRTIYERIRTIFARERPIILRFLTIWCGEFFL